MGALADWLAAIKALAVTAGAAVTPKYSDVELGAPVPRGRCVRIWWAGEVSPPPQMEGRYTLSSELIGHEIVVTAFEPLSDQSEAQTRNAMAAIGDFMDHLRETVDADRTLGGVSSSVAPEPVAMDYAVIGGILYGFASMVLPVGHIEYTIGA